MTPDRTVRLPRRAETSVRCRTTGVAGEVLADVVSRPAVAGSDELSGVGVGVAA